MLVCSKCGHENDPTWMRCGKCLKPLRSGRDLISGVCPACGFAMMPTEVACLRCAKRQAEDEARADDAVVAYEPITLPEPEPLTSVAVSLPPDPSPAPMVIDPAKPSAILKNHLLERQANSAPLVFTPQAFVASLRTANVGLIAGLWVCVGAAWFLSANGQPMFSLGADAAALAIALTLAQRPNLADKANGWLAVVLVTFAVGSWALANFGGINFGGGGGGGDGADNP